MPKIMSQNLITPHEYLTRGMAKNDRKDYEGALEDYNQAIKIAPFYSKAYICRASVRAMRMKDYSGAIEDYTLAIEHYARDSQLPIRLDELYYERANVKSTMKEYQTAIIDYSLAIGLNPLFVLAYLRRGVCKSSLSNSIGRDQDFNIALKAAGKLGDGGLYNEAQRVIAIYEATDEYMTKLYNEST